MNRKGRRIWPLIAMILGFAVGVAPHLTAKSTLPLQQAQDIDWQRANALHQRVMRGEKLTPDDQAYYERAKVEYNRRQRSQGQGPAVNPPRESTGMPPVTDMGEAKYKGESGGLYGGGSNQPPK